jgi:hypothetical protein
LPLMRAVDRGDVRSNNHRRAMCHLMDALETWGFSERISAS